MLGQMSLLLFAPILGIFLSICGLSQSLSSFLPFLPCFFLSFFSLSLSLSLSLSRFLLFNLLLHLSIFLRPSLILSFKSGPGLRSGVPTHHTPLDRGRCRVRAPMTTATRPVTSGRCKIDVESALRAFITVQRVPRTVSVGPSGSWVCMIRNSTGSVRLEPTLQ